SELVGKLRRLGNDEWGEKDALKEALDLERLVTENAFEQVKMWQEIQAHILADLGLEHYFRDGISPSAKSGRLGRDKAHQKGELTRWLKVKCSKDSHIHLQEKVPGHVIIRLAAEAKQELGWRNYPGLPNTIRATLSRLGYSKERKRP
ncbi:MAG: hypothetical protein WBW16_03050, partial [Bacteroidota bacterium]